MNACMPADSTPSGPRPAPGSEDKLDRLRTLLREMFQLDRGDLDFGLYRIMNMKASEITAFLDGDLLPQAQGVLKGISAEDRAKLDAELGDTLATLRKLGVPNPEESDRVKDLRRQIADARADAEAEADVYGHLANFFARYYSEGDFMSQRRYSGATGPAYLVPYDGEEVKLHWANADQYYVKTTENYASYVFTIGNERRRVRFEIAAADNEKDNVKELAGKQRRFLLPRTKPVTAEGEELVVRFEHRPLTDGEKKRFPGNGNHQQGRINAAVVERIRNFDALDPTWRALLTTPAPTGANPDRTVLAKHLERYTAKNTFDYFIHKDLAGFLSRELDLYLKSEVLNIDDLALGDEARLRRALAHVRTIRHMADKIIAFLAQLEEFQKRLWLKKKFVLETQYCVTLDRVPEALYPDIAANAAQREEWVDLLAIDEVAGDLANGGTGYTEPLTVEFLKANPYLVLDTRHFDADFTDRLLEALSDTGPLDEHMDGLLVHGENFQALNLLQRRYWKQVDCVYADPPYNTDSSPILYKNDLKDSSWLSLMEDRVSLAKTFLANHGIMCCAIDDEEIWRLRALLQSVFDKEIGVVPVRSTPIGRTSRGKFSPTHEYALFYGGEGAVPGSLEKTEKERQRYPLVDEHGHYAWRNLLRTGTDDMRADRPKQFYPIFVSDSDDIRIPEMEWDEQGTEYRILERPREDEVEVWPVARDQGGNRIEKRWERGWERVHRETRTPGEYRVQRSDNGSGGQEVGIHFVQRMGVSSVPKTWWGESKYASSNHGARVLNDLFVDNPFDFPKSVPLVEDCIRASGGGRLRAQIVDFFAGSGTTGHAVINLNRDDDGRRKYVLVEVGNHFETVMLPRIKKVVHSPDWQNGKPISRKGISQFFKYIRLESYEDTMDGLKLTPLASDLLEKNAALAEDYRLRYSLDTETAGSACLLGGNFLDPFAYVLSVVRDGACRNVPVNLPETFNHLIGLREESRRRIDDVLVFSGTDAERRKCLILWRNLEETDNEALEAWFERNRALVADTIDIVYVNGDNTLNALGESGDAWTVETIEPIFRELMFVEDR